MAEMTPMMRQYVQIKEENKDAILMFRLGDFYEMFFDDAVTASKELELTLTGRDCGLEERAPMCGVPFHAAQNYITRLVAKGYKVAICEQVENPADAQGLVKREVIRIVTPGTNLDEGVVNSQNTNYISAVLRKKDKDALVFADVSSGELSATVIENDESGNLLVNELSRFSPVEIALGADAIDNKRLGEYIENSTNALLFTFDHARFEANWESIVAPQIRNYGEIEDKDLLTAVAAIISYINETQKSSVPHMKEISLYTPGEFVEIDAATRRNLELTETMREKQKRGSLYGVLDKTKTAMGSRCIKNWILRPLVNPVLITNRLDAVEEMVKNIDLREDVAEYISTIWDIERLMARVSLKMANAKDLVALRNSFREIPAIKNVLKGCKSAYLAYREGRVDPLEDIYKLLDSAIVDEPPVTLREGNIIKSGYDDEIDRLKLAAKSGREFIASLEAKERERTGIKNLKVGFNKVFGYYIDVSKGNVSKVPDDYIRKQTLVNNERFITLELKEAESAVLGAQERLIDLEYEAFVKVREEVAASLERIMRTAKAISEIDAIYALATVAVKNNYTKPTVSEGSELIIENGRHCVVEHISKGVFVPNDTHLDGESDFAMIITGPNMAGKSTYMRQTALIVLLAQMGSFVPASRCAVGVTDKIFTRIGASDDLTKGQSTFMMEMSEVSYILKNATKKSLVILDEIGRGTSTFDGLSIAWAVMEHIAKKVKAKTLFATHYHELAVLENELSGVKNYNTACKKRGDDITFLRKIVPGSADQSYGIEVALLAGVPQNVVKRAKEILKTVESGETKVHKVEKPEPSMQIGFAMTNPIVEELKNIDPTVLTPIEAMNKLYEICQKAKNM